MEGLFETLKKKWKEILGILVVFGLVFLIGVLVGRKHQKVITNETIKYIELPQKTDTIKIPVPVKEKVDTSNIIKQLLASGLFNKTDTVYLTKSDTSKVLEDWVTERLYSEKLFDDDTLGNLTVNTTIKYNRLQQMDYIFNPKQKVITKEVEFRRKYMPFVGGGISTFPKVSVDVGMIFNQSWGMALEGSYYFNSQVKYDAGIKIYKVF